MTEDFSSENMEARRKWHNNFQVLKKGAVVLYPVKIYFRNKEEIRTF